MARIQGIDVSNHQGDVNYDVVKANNWVFNIMKATEGTGFRDPKLTRNQNESRRVGMGVGYYHFARPDLGNSAEAEAAWFLKAVGTIRQGEMLVLDYEPQWNGDAVGWSKRFLEYVFQKTNTRALIYLNQAQTQQYNWKPVVDGGYGLWLAAYTNDPNNNTGKTGAWPWAAMQQFSSSWKVPGIVGNVDANIFFGDMNAFKRYGYQGNLTPTPTPTPAPTPTAATSSEIIASYKTLCGEPPTQDELNFRLQEGKTLEALTHDLCTGDARFYNRWIKPYVASNLEQYSTQNIFNELKKRFNLN